MRKYIEIRFGEFVCGYWGLKGSGEMVWYFISVYIINRTLDGCLEIRNFSSLVEKYFTRLLGLLMKYYSPLEEKFRISARGHVISPVYKMT